jgi:hypothetical protein
LVGYWTFDGKDTPWTSSSAATTLDKSGNGNTGTLTNMLQSTTPVPGKIGQALSFNGSSNYVDVADISSLNPTNVTVSSWVKTSTTTGYVVAKDPGDITTGLVGWWKMDDGSGTSVVDSSGNSNTGTIQNSSLMTWVTGKIGNAVQGTTEGVGNPDNGSWIKVPNATALNISQSITIAFWVYKSGGNISNNFYDGVLSKGEASGGSYGFLFTHNGSAAPYFALTDTGNTGHYLQGADLSAGGWVHYVGTYDGSVMHLYVNGSIDESGGGSGNTGTFNLQQNTDDLWFGRVYNPTLGLNLGGAIDDIRIYNRALSSTDVTALYAYDGVVAKTNVPYALSTVNGGEFLIKNGASTYTVDSSVSVADGKWHLLSGTYDGTTMRIYVDGVQKGSGTSFSGNLPTQAGNVRIGADYQTTPANFFTGNIDDTRIYNRALSAGEVKQLYNMGR